MNESIIVHARYFTTILIMTLIVPFTSSAQRIESVHGTATLSLSDNDNITLKEAKIKCVEKAKIEAIKKEFGELVWSDFLVSTREVNDEIISTYIEDAASSVKGEWLNDERAPEIKIDYDGKNLNFTAEVWGKAREIVRARTDVKWHVLKDLEGNKIDSEHFNNGERFFIKFKSPNDGYVAIYLITSDKETACLLPYRKDNSGRFKIKGGKEYVFFDREEDSNASYYKLRTDQPQEMNQLVMIYSPHPFAKCTDKSVDPWHPNVIEMKDFAKWLLKNQRADKEMMVNRTWVTINGTD